MYETHPNSAVVWRSPLLAAFPSLTHFVSTRHAGNSSAPFASMNLSFRVGDPPEVVTANRERLFTAAGVRPEQVVAAKQVHATHVTLVDRTLAGRGARDFESALDGTDALVCGEPGICLLVMAADCVPILLFDPVQRVVGAAHAGWRGTVASMATIAVHILVTTYGSDPKDLVALIGPSIGPDDYEVGDEVVDAVRTAFPATWDQQIRCEPSGRPHFDLWTANRLQLIAAGLTSDHIEVAGISTHATPDHFFSERRDHFPTGRFAAGIMLNP